MIAGKGHEQGQDVRRPHAPLRRPRGGPDVAPRRLRARGCDRRSSLARDRAACAAERLTPCARAQTEGDRPDRRLAARSSPVISSSPSGAARDFADEALAAGAAAALVPDDAFGALAAIARAVRERSDARVVGITGSIAKTSTKDILAALVRPHRAHGRGGGEPEQRGRPAADARPHRPRHRGLRARDGHARARARSPSSARPRRPHIGVITKIGPVHLELLGTVERVAQAKAELVRALAAGRHGGRPRRRSAARAVPRPRGHRCDSLRPRRRRRSWLVHAARRRARPSRSSAFGERISTSSCRSRRATTPRTCSPALAAYRALGLPLARRARAPRRSAVALARGGAAAPRTAGSSSTTPTTRTRSR